MGPPVVTPEDRNKAILSPEGILGSILGGLAVAVVLSWLTGKTPLHLSRKRLAFLALLLSMATFLGRVYMRRQRLRYRRDQALSEITSFVSNSNDFDSACEATLSLVQEVELVSRGYRMYARRNFASFSYSFCG